MPKHWRLAPHDPARIADLERAAGVPSLVAHLLLSRGIHDPADVRQFLDPKLTGLRDPELLPGAAAAADLLYQAYRAKRRITVYGDYDADGMTATAILVRCLRMLDAQVDFYVPHRIDEGYGVNSEAIAKLAEQGADVVVTVDCGICSVAEARLAKELGLTLIVTDHHQMDAELPDAAALVHPALPGSEYPFKGLCGAAVAFKLAWALCQRVAENKRVNERMRQFLLQAVGLAAIGTVADVVPLIDENRILVRHGLQSLTAYPTIGMSALMRQIKLHEKHALECEDLGFSIGPRLNAAGRMGQAELGIELLTTESEVRAEKLAKYIDELNLERQTLERSILRAADKQARERFDPSRDSALVLADHDWHPGIIGIVAGRVADKFHMPAIVIALDKLGVKPGVGSARSVPGFNLHAALAECSELLESHGGHAAAAGLRVTEANLPAFRRKFCDVVARELGEGSRLAELFVDVETTFSCLTQRTVEQIEKLAPFGHGNLRPVLCASEVRLTERPKRMGGAGRHLSMTFDQAGIKLRAVAFGGGDWEDELAAINGEMSIAFRPVINRYRGRASVEIHLADWRLDSAQ
ncbi:single-stranded-DNA-specific exonuclease RecJ [Lacipirellula parvula]|uniref:Single-stranded-DNA-specific exonuclease RecJ n=1 Tax=Lacipirellula parvula TaxID=2650471 RepID=A0A5K7XCN5_9BACT|nr:single-stranded-DNA-specific exonuclease RecJ [Lacipirellula parvula]BBO32146.1 single-stranded-DNA-specific exonuclease RecJ [Lacipirellula parvula]